MRIVLDTNILLVSVSDRSPYHLIFKSFIEERYEICITTEILDEYAEILSKYSSQFLATNTLEVIENAANSVLITRYFSFELIKNDPDDNKFVDLTIATNADYLVTNDKHFNILKSLDFPPIRVVSLMEFKEIIKL